MADRTESSLAPAHGAADAFLRPESMVTPGALGALTMLITNSVQHVFPALDHYKIALALAFIFGLAAVIKAVSAIQKSLYYFINSLIIFSVATGTNTVGVSTVAQADLSIVRSAAASTLYRTGSSPVSNYSIPIDFFQPWFGQTALTSKRPLAFTSPNANLILEVCRRYDVTDVAQLAYVLATAQWETAQTMTPVSEGFYLGTDSANAYRRKRPYYPFYGRGFIQLTGRASYALFSKALNIDLIDDPDKALEPAVAAQIICLSMRDGSLTGKKLTDYIHSSTMDFVDAMKIVDPVYNLDYAKDIAALAMSILPWLASDR